MATLLARRGMHDAEAARHFLRPSLNSLHDPYSLLGMGEAVERLQRARLEKEDIALLGDYDVDGVSGTALLTAVLRACGLTVHPMLPHRIHDGYGLQESHVEKAASLGCAILMTVDCGTTAHRQLERARELGLDAIVTDHHIPGEPLPEGTILINPHQDACAYPFPDLSAAGLAFKLGLAFAQACGKTVDPKALARVACLGTIADMVPLEGENRTIAAVGLAELTQTRSHGLRALLRIAKLRPPLNAADVGFRLGPRLNAPGRLGSAEMALQLILSRDSGEAQRLAEAVERRNRERQEMERRISSEALEAVEGLPSLPPILLLWGEGWHRGVMGIAAGRLARRFHRPAILLAVEGERATGSGRSVQGVDLHAFLKTWEGSMCRFGGHAQAVGLTVETARLEGLRQELEAAATWDGAAARPPHEYELALGPAEANRRLLNEMLRLEPHGLANPQPLILLRGPLRLVGKPRIFGQGHLSAELQGEDEGRMRCLGWGWEEKRHLLEAPFEALGYLELDRYRDCVTFRLVDCRPYEGSTTDEVTSEARQDDIHGEI